MTLSAEHSNNIVNLMEKALAAFQRADRHRSASLAKSDSYYQQFSQLTSQGHREAAIALLMKMGMSNAESVLIYNDLRGQDMRLEEITLPELLSTALMGKEVSPDANCGIDLIFRVGSSMLTGFIRCEDDVVILSDLTGGMHLFKDVAQAWRMVPKGVTPA